MTVTPTVNLMPTGIAGTSASVLAGGLALSTQGYPADAFGPWCTRRDVARIAPVAKANHLRPLGLLGGTSG